MVNYERVMNLIDTIFGNVLLNMIVRFNVVEKGKVVEKTGKDIVRVIENVLNNGRVAYNSIYEVENDSQRIVIEEDQKVVDCCGFRVGVLLKIVKVLVQESIRVKMVKNHLDDIQEKLEKVNHIFLVREKVNQSNVV